MGNKVFAIAGYDPDSDTFLSTVSKYDTASDTWEGLNAILNKARCFHSACTLNRMIYVFCGGDENYKDYLNSIEVISETSLVQNSTATWQLIEVPQNILIPREFPGVAPMNDTEIVIMGGHGSCGRYLSHIVVFNTTTN